jgi:hypothetical protein
MSKDEELDRFLDQEFNPDRNRNNKIEVDQEGGVEMLAYNLWIAKKAEEFGYVGEEENVEYIFNRQGITDDERSLFFRILENIKKGLVQLWKEN